MTYASSTAKGLTRVYFVVFADGNVYHEKFAFLCIISICKIGGRDNANMVQMILLLVLLHFYCYHLSNFTLL